MKPRAYDFVQRAARGVDDPNLAVAMARGRMGLAENRKAEPAKALPVVEVLVGSGADGGNLEIRYEIHGL